VRPSIREHCSSIGFVLTVILQQWHYWYDIGLTTYRSWVRVMDKDPCGQHYQTVGLYNMEEKVP